MARVQTGRIDGNQARIDELEYFLEGIGRFLFGDDGEDFRTLADYVPRSRNVSGLLDLARTQGGGDVAEDLRFLYGELEVRTRRFAEGADATPHGLPDPSPTAVFRYGRYLDLLERPERLIEAVPVARRLEVASLVTSGAARFAPMLARVNAYAWLGVVGLPGLEGELGAEGAASIGLIDDEETAERGLERLIASAAPRLGEGLETYYRTAFRELGDDYRGQLARYAARTTE